MAEIVETNAAPAAESWTTTRAEDAEGRPVRVSSLPLPEGLSDAAKARISEALNAAMADCAQGRLSVLSWGEHEGALHIVEPAASPASLREVVAESGPLPAARIIPLLHGVTSVLDAMEAAGMRHGWLTPDNVFPGTATQIGGQAWTSVFSILRAECPAFQWPAGAYSAPEVRGGEPVDAAAECWSAAALASFALSGREPVPNAAPADAPPAMANALRRALNPSPDVRHADVKTLVVDLTVEHAIGMTDIADTEVVPSGGEVPDWARSLLRETDARREAGQPLVDTAPTPTPAANGAAPAHASGAAAAAPAAARPAAAAAPRPAAPAPSPVTAAAPAEPRPADANEPAVFDWNAGAPRRSLMPVIASVVAVLFILAGLALTFLRK